MNRPRRRREVAVADNATSHTEGLAAFVARVATDAEFTDRLIAVLEGEYVAVKTIRSPAEPPTHSIDRRARGHA
jgi:hypothetical protein